MGRVIFALGAVLIAASVDCAASAATPPQPITFVRDGRIVATDALGGPVAALVPPGGGRYAGDSGPSWDRHGRTLFFSRARTVGRDDQAAQIHFLGPDGIVRRLTPRSRAYESSAAISPDGLQVAFGRLRITKKDFAGDIVIRSLVTGAERVVVHSRFPLGGLGDPQWTPDGKSLLYTRISIDRRSYFRPSLRLVGVDGTADRQFRSDAGAARFSPDGRRLAFVSVADRNGQTCGSDECEYNGELYVMNTDGTGAVRLTNNEGGDGVASWSADGRRLTFASTRNFPESEKPEVYSIGADGSCLTWLTNGTQTSGEPVWRPGAGASQPAACGAAGRAPVNATSERPLKRVRGFEPVWLGRSIGTMMLSRVDLSREGISLSYEDCSAFDPKDCGASVQVSTQSVCRPRELELLGSAGGLRGFRGVPAEFFGSEGGYHLYSDRSVVQVGLDSPPLDDRVARRHFGPVLRALRPYPASRPAGRLPAVRLPVPVLRRVRRAAQLRRRLGSVQTVARLTGSHPSVVRRRLVIARALSRLPRGRPLRCP